MRSRWGETRRAARSRARTRAPHTAARRRARHWTFVSPRHSPRLHTEHRHTVNTREHTRCGRHVPARHTLTNERRRRVTRTRRSVNERRSYTTYASLPHIRHRSAVGTNRGERWVLRRGRSADARRQTWRHARSGIGLGREHPTTTQAGKHSDSQRSRSTPPVATCGPDPVSGR